MIVSRCERRGAIGVVFDLVSLSFEAVDDECRREGVVLGEQYPSRMLDLVGRLDAVA